MRRVVSLVLLVLAGGGLVAARPATATQESPPGPDGALAPAAAPDLEIQAVGLVRAATPERSTAVLRSQGRTRAVAVGESAFGARLLAVGPDTVQIEHDGRPYELRLAPVPIDPLPAPSRTAPLTSDEPPEDPTTPAREMEKRQVQIRLGEEMNRILTETALVPALEDGRVVGLQVRRVAEGSLLTDAGLRAGDVLTRINDTTIDGMATLISLWPRLQNASELRAVVLRGGQPFLLRVTFR